MPGGSPMTQLAAPSVAPPTWRSSAELPGIQGFDVSGSPGLGCHGKMMVAWDMNGISWELKMGYSWILSGKHKKHSVAMVWMAHPICFNNVPIKHGDV